MREQQKYYQLLTFIHTQLCTLLNFFLFPKEIKFKLRLQYKENLGTDILSESLLGKSHQSDNLKAFKQLKHKFII